MGEVATFQITRLGAQGDGVAMLDGHDQHIPDTLPGEMVERDATGHYRVIGPPSPARREEPLCTHVPRCGGCSVQHMGDDLYRTWKSGLLSAALSQRGLSCPISPMRSVPLGSRRRATFTGAWRNGAVELGFHGRESHDLEPITDCAVLRPSIVAALPHLARIAAMVAPKGKPFRLSVLAADNGMDFVIDQKPASGSDRHAAEIAKLMQRAGAIRLTCGSDLILQHAAPSVLIAGVAVTPPPGAFLQAAAETDDLLAGLVLDGLGKAKRVLDLFCGLGTLSFALARRARVTAIDSESTLLAALQKASHGAQGLKPIQHVRRDLFRDPLSPQELAAADAVVLDPPRAGAAAQCQSLARSKVRRVVMVSCNPATLARDLRTLVDGGYRLDGATPVDQFLYSHHLEAVTVLSRA